ncbi:hypothetical protein L596_018152 [Steinernema carpocapsae]|uniref:Uncharacterized protein n=1 Tax=Steinernema carpocapsae TaxID=34508 RepID=A0A4U5N3T5_STECR|nr:hypothetical protein L596_018152 [Steinernema carpocapsae]
MASVNNTSPVLLLFPPLLPLHPKARGAPVTISVFALTVRLPLTPPPPHLLNRSYDPLDTFRPNSPHVPPSRRL